VRITQLQNTLANAVAAGNSRGNQDLQERCRADIDTARLDYTFETKREETREKHRKTLEEKRMKYQQLCVAFTNIPGLSMKDSTELP